MQFETLFVRNAEDGALRTARSIDEAESLSVGGAWRRYLFEHDVRAARSAFVRLKGKPVITRWVVARGHAFPDHALARDQRPHEGIAIDAVFAAGVPHGVKTGDRTADTVHSEFEECTDRSRGVRHDIVDQVVWRN